MNQTFRYVFLILSVVGFESIAQYNLKQSKLNNNNIFYLILAIIAYSFVCLMLRKCYDYTGMGITNLVWSIVSIITMILIGTFAFHEVITKNDILGIILCIIGLYFIFIKEHKI